MKLSEKDYIVFTFTDMKHLFLRHRKKILTIAGCFGLLAFLFLLVQPIQYQVEATFRQANRQGDNLSTMKKVVQQLAPSGSESSMIAIMQCNEVIKDVVERLGLQVVCSSDSLLMKALRRVAQNIYLGLGGTLSDPDRFCFTDVSYSGEKPLPLFLKLKDREVFQLFDENNQLLGEKKLGEPLAFSTGQLTLTSAPKNVKIGSFYSLSVSPWMDVINHLRPRLKITPHKLDKNILQLVFLHRDRILGAAFLNRLMLSYQDYLKRENDEFCQQQLQYLKKRQEELAAYYDEALVDHAAYLKQNLVDNGFIGFEEEITTLSEPKTFYTTKLFEVDLELKRLYDSMQMNLLAHTDEKNEEPQKTSDEFLGLNLTTAQQLLVEYTRQRDSLQAQIRELFFLREQLPKPGFEVSSLGSLVDDGVIREQVNKASAIAMQIQDENNRSTREQERLTEALQTQKNFLSQHLLQTVDLKKIRLNLLAEKIAFLQQTTLSLLQIERDLLTNKLSELSGKMGDLPEKWRRESLLAIKKELGAATLEGVSQMIESKFLGRGVFQVDSKPLDLALAPLQPKPPNFFLKTAIATLFAGFCSYVFIFCMSLFKGLPVSKETLQLSGFPVGGRLSKYCNTQLSQIRETDLETLRHVADRLLTKSKIQGGLIAVCIGGQHPNYSSSLAELLAMRGVKTAVIHCIFDKVVHPEEMPGLWQYLQGEIGEPPLKKQSTYDLMTSGGTSRHGLETLFGSQFQNLLDDLKKRYGVVLLYSSFDPAKREGSSLLQMADVALVTVQQETKEDLEVYLEWTEQKANASATFLYAEEFG